MPILSDNYWDYVHARHLGRDKFLDKVAALERGLGDLTDEKFAERFDLGLYAEMDFAWTYNCAELRMWGGFVNEAY